VRPLRGGFMALYRLSVKIGSKGSGRAHFDYISGDGKYKRIGTEDDIRLTRSNAIPSWAKSPRDFWKEEEKIGDGFRKIELALPVELEPKNQERLVEQFVNKNFKDYPCTYAIHDSKNGENPHVHIMFSERKRVENREEPSREQFFRKSRTRKDGTVSGGYAKDTTITKGAGRKQWLLDLRKDWEYGQNIYLERANVPERVDCRSLKDQGVDRVPQIHVGAKAWRMQERSERFCENMEIIAVNSNMKRISAEIDELNHSIEQAGVELRDIWLEKLSNTHKQTNREPEGEAVTLGVSGVSALRFYSNGVVSDCHGRNYEASDIAQYKNGEDYPLHVNGKRWSINDEVRKSQYIHSIERSRWHKEEQMSRRDVLDSLQKLNAGYGIHSDIRSARLNSDGINLEIDRLISHPQWVEMLNSVNRHEFDFQRLVGEISKNEAFIQEYGTDLVKELCYKQKIEQPMELRNRPKVLPRIVREKRAERINQATKEITRDTGMSR
jgi:hypothetical protein